MKCLTFIVGMVIAAIMASTAMSYVTPCETYGSGPYGAICLHSGDTNRANLSHWTLHVRGPNWSTSWYNNAAVYGAAQGSLTGPNRMSVVNETNQACPNYYQTGNVSGATGAGQYIQTYTCLNNYTYLCGDPPVDWWIACTAPWVWGQYSGGSVYGGPHIYTVETDFKLSAIYHDTGGTYPWTDFQKQATACHEIGGHQFGGNHSSTVPGEGDSCLAAFINDNQTPNTLGTQVISDISSWTNHNDTNAATGLWDIRYVATHRTLFKHLAKKSKRLILAQNPLLYAAAGIPFKVIPVPVGHGPVKGLPPIGTAYAFALPSSPVGAINTGTHISVFPGPVDAVGANSRKP